MQRKLALLTAAACLLASAVAASAATPAEREQTLIPIIKNQTRDDAAVNRAAAELGDLGSLAGLQELLNMRKLAAVDIFHQHYSKINSPLPADIQALIIKNFDYDEGREHLAQFVYKRPYDNRDLYQAILGVAHRQEKVMGAFQWYELLLISTTQNIESQTLGLYRHLDETGKKRLLEFMVGRKFAGALPYFERYHDEMPLGPQSLYVHSKLVQFATSEAAATLITILKKYNVPKTDPVYRDLTASALLHLQQFPPSAVVDFSTFIGDIPFLKEVKIAKLFIALVQQRHPKEAVRYLLAYLHNKDHYQQAFDALASYVDLDAWRLTREELFKAYREGIFDTPYHKAAMARLEQNYQQYEQLAAKDKQSQGTSPLAAELQELRNKHGLDGLQNASAKQAISAYEGYADELNAIYKKYRKQPDSALASQAMVDAARTLGNLHRFLLADGKTARKYYQQAMDTAADHRLNEAYAPALLLAESMHFDNQDKDEAVKAYTNALDELRRSASLEKNPTVRQWLEIWLVKQVRFLKTGTPFKESARASAENFGAIVGFMMDLLALENIGEFKQKTSSPADLAQMPKSHFLFPYYVLQARDQPPEGFLGSVAGIDPSGYWLANYFDFINLNLKSRESAMAQNLWKMGKTATVRDAREQYAGR